MARQGTPYVASHALTNSGPYRPQAQRAVVLSLVLLAAWLLSGCVAAVPVAQSADLTQAPVGGERLTDIADIDLPTPPPVIVPDVSAVIITEDARANVRSGPAIDAPIVAKANPGDSFEVTGKSADNLWWQVCCVPSPTDPTGDATESAWLSSEVVQVEGNEEAVPVVNALLPETLNASWQVDWSCGSERCEIKACSGTIAAESNGDSTQQWLQVEHNVNWDDDCFETDSWVFEVDRFSGDERSGAFIEDFRYNYWAGSQPGPPTDVFTFDDGRQVTVWCSAEQEFDVPVGDGWTNAVSGSTCHDVRTGELVYITYVTRWLFTGEYDGQRYERAYFGDYETLEQYLVDTNAELSYIQ